MQNMSDNELDNLFKEAAEGFTPPQDASAWTQMASMLDKNPVKPPSLWNWKTISVLAVSGLIAVSTVWYATTGNQEKISKTNEKNGANNATQSVVQEQKEQPHATDNENFASTQSVENKSSGARALTNAESEVDNKQKETNLFTQRKSEGGKGNDSGTIHKDEKSLTGNEQQVLASVDQSITQRVVTDSENNSPAASMRVENVALVNDSAQTTDKTLKPDSTTNVSRIADKKDDKVRSEARFSIKAAFSPDFSSVNYFSAGKTGSNYGLLVGYSLNNRWSVYTGVISSRKLYDTKDVEGTYNWNDHDYPMKELDGDCRILDIPLNVYYTFFPERSFSIKAGLGFSSYIMRKEKYVYCVDNYGDNAYYEQNVNGKNNEWFKVMNVSVMVSKTISNRLSAEFEPFVKAPLAGVGEGKVSLVSMGAFINLKYDLFIIK